MYSSGRDYIAHVTSLNFRSVYSASVEVSQTSEIFSLSSSEAVCMLSFMLYDAGRVEHKHGKVACVNLRHQRATFVIDSQLRHE